MMLRPVWLVGLVVCFSVQAFAQEAQEVKPAAPAASAAIPAPQAATPAPPPAGARTTTSEVAIQPATSGPTAEPASTPLAEGELDADKIMAAQKAGYQIKNENGQTLLCRRDKLTGSHARYRTSCMTAREWEQLRSDNEQMLKTIERRPRMSNQ